MRVFKTISWILLLLLSAPGLAESPRNTEVIHPCTEREHWTYGSNIPAKWQKHLSTPPRTPRESIETWAWAYGLKNLKSIEPQFVGQYWLARSLVQLGLNRLAYHEFERILKTSKGPNQVAIAAMECISKLQSKLPSQVLSDEAADRLRNLPTLPLTHEQKNILFETVSSNLKRRIGQLEDLHFTSNYPSALHESLLRTMRGSALGLDSEVIQGGKLFLKEVAALESPLAPTGTLLTTGIRDEKDAVSLLLGRAYFDAKEFDKAILALREVRNSSNFFPETLTTLAWAYLRKNQYADAAGTAYNLMLGNLSKTFSIEAPIIVAMSLYETCHFPEAYKSLQVFSNSFAPSFRWLKKWQMSGSRPLYHQVVKYLENEKNLPDPVGTELLKSRVFLGNQELLNDLLEEKSQLSAISALISEREKKKESSGYKVAEKALHSLLGRFRDQVPTIEIYLISQINADLASKANSMIETLGSVNSNGRLIEAEIFNDAGSDFEVGSLRQDPARTAFKIRKKLALKRKGEGSTLDWGTYTSGELNNGLPEVWADELGFLRTELPDNCAN